MKRFGLFAAAMLLVFGGSVGCSVLEQRRECLGRATFDFSKISLLSGDSLYFEVRDFADGNQDYYAAFAREDIPQSLTMDIRQGAKKVKAFCGAEGAAGLIVKAGQEYPHLYAGFDEITVGDIPVTDTVRLFKRYCNVSFLMSYEDEVAPYSVRILGNVAGYDEDLEPVEGAFSFNAENNRSVNIPQQLDGSLALELKDANGLGRRFAIGQMILSSGYDWSARSLDNIVVALDYSTLKVTIGVDAWSETYEFSIDL